MSNKMFVIRQSQKYSWTIENDSSFDDKEAYLNAMCLLLWLLGLDLPPEYQPSPGKLQTPTTTVSLFLF